MVDVVLTSERDLETVDPTGWNVIHVAIRAAWLNRYYHKMDALLRAQFAYPTIDFRYIISPSSKLPHNWEPLSFSEDQIQASLELGENDGKAAEVLHRAEDSLEFFALLKKGAKMTYGEFLTQKHQGVFADY